MAKPKSTVTLAEAAKLSQLRGEALKSANTVSDMFELLPFENIPGGSLTYNRERTTGKPTPVTSPLVEIDGVAEIC